MQVMKQMKDEFGTYYFKDGIVFFITRERFVLDLPEAKKIAAAFKLFQGGKPHPLCVDITELADTTKLARDFMAREVQQFATRCAFVSESSWGIAIANFFLTVSKPVVPTKVFSNREKAIAFLLSADPGD